MGAYIIDEIQGSGRLSISQNGMTGIRIARCAWNNWPGAVLGLMGTPVWYNGFIAILGRESWPGLPGLLVDSVDVEPLGTMINSGWYDGPSYNYAKLTINYKVNEAEDNKDEKGEPGTWLIEKLDYSVEVAVIPVQVVDEADKKKLERDAAAELAIYLAAPTSNADGSPAPVMPKPIPAADRVPKKKTLKRYVRIPTITYTTTMPKVPFLPGGVIQEGIGRINSKPIFGANVGTVLFDGPSAERESIFFTQRFWRIEYKFIYQPFGWNNTLHPDTLKWVAAKAVGADNDPHEYYDLRNLFPAPYKVR